MISLPFDPEDPPTEPPPGVTSRMLWLVAVRLYRDHVFEPLDRPRQGPPRCRQCLQPWPCAARRLAERGLIGALSEPDPPADDPRGGLPDPSGRGRWPGLDARRPDASGEGGRPW